MRILFTGCLTLALAVGATAEGIWRRSWDLDNRITVAQKEKAVKLHVSDGTSYEVSTVTLTLDEAASLGQALLEAAGEKPKECRIDRTDCPWGAVCVVPGDAK